MITRSRCTLINITLPFHVGDADRLINTMEPVFQPVDQFPSSVGVKEVDGALEEGVEESSPQSH